MEKILATNSSNVESVGYYDEKNIMEVEFKGKITNSFYHYQDVPPDVFSGLKDRKDMPGFSFGRWVREALIEKGYKKSKVKK